MITILLMLAALSVAPPATPDDPEQELQTGIALTRNNEFQQAIPHFLAARGRVAESFALEFNLALCYLGTRQYSLAIETLINIQAGKTQTAQLGNLLAQAYIGNSQPDKALDALKKAAAITPANEKLYAFVSDACLEHGDYDLGIEVVNIGLKNLPNSPRLLFQRGLFESRLEETDLANRDFDEARRLAAGSDLGYIAGAEEALSSGKIAEAIRIARGGVRNGHPHYMLLTMLGEALIRSGATPGTPEFNEAQSALEKAISEKPDYSSAQLTIGKLYLLENRLPEAITHLELARALDPHDPAVYPSLAAVYRRTGQPGKTREALAALALINKEQAARIASAPGGHAGIAGPPR